MMSSGKERYYSMDRYTHGFEVEEWWSSSQLLGLQIDHPDKLCGAYGPRDVLKKIGFQSHQSTMVRSQDAKKLMMMRKYFLAQARHSTSPSTSPHLT